MKEQKLEFGECEISISTMGTDTRTMHWLLLHKKRKIRNRAEMKEWLKQLRKSLTIASLDKTMIRR